MTHSPTIDVARSTELRHAAIAAARSVEAPLVEAFRSAMSIEFKRDQRDIVTAHDKAAEVTICAHLKAAVPDSAFIGEEGGVQGNGSVQWYIDPIDGTANFARGMPSWCISIGAVCNGQIVAGAIVDPMGGNVFSADLAGAYHGDKPLRSKATPDEGLATLLCSYPSARDLKIDGRDIALDRFGVLVETYSAVRRIGSAALGLAHVAAGWADASANFSINAWDVTAGILILRQAGGHYQPINMGTLRDGTADYMYPAYIALGAGTQCSTLVGIAQDIASNRSETVQDKP
ncbi:inositol monophosphatase family protein [Oceanibium sediminis]|uniref:inositol monophosphatase family protein n=1 Tax=Oceanibium sediminis TaxID=2026339 RepID=UPI000DD3C519|nr:inositol monophosphatase family protein [Oceanibium sediminis]